MRINASAPTGLVGRLVVRSLLLAALVAPAAAEDGQKVDCLALRLFGEYNVPWRRPDDFTFPRTDTLEFEIPNMFRFSGFPFEFQRYVVAKAALRSSFPFDRGDIGEEPSVHLRWRAVGDAKPLERELRRHHIGIQVGIFNPSTDAIALGDLGLDLERSDGLTILRYRYSLNPRIDLVAEGRYWTGRGPTARSGEAKVSGGFVGPGIRVHASTGTKGRRVVPYLQGNVYYVQEMLGEPEVLHEYGIGLGLSGGMDLAVTRLISIPVEVTYVGSDGGGLDDLSGFGVSVGVSVHF